MQMNTHSNPHHDHRGNHGNDGYREITVSVSDAEHKKKETARERLAKIGVRCGVIMGIIWFGMCVKM